MKNQKTIIKVLAGCLIMTSCQSYEPLETVSQVDLDRYKGKWYELARLPQRFEKDCACVTAEYTQEESYIGVKNTCYDTVDTKWRVSEGKAFPVEESNNARLEVQFFFPFKGDYYIMSLDDEYEYALVGSPSRSYLWILSRQKMLAKETMNRLLQLAETRGFDTDALIYTDQACEQIPKSS